MVDLGGYSWILPVAEEAYARREEIISNWEKIKTFLQRKRLSIAVTGLPGVGKTVLCDYLTGKAYNQFYSTPARSEDVEYKDMKTKKQLISFSVLPGQNSPKKLGALDELFGDETPVDGVIYVVANGFSTIRSPFSQQLTSVSNLQAYREARFEEEIEDLNEICDYIRKSMRQSNQPAWMLIAVTKLDLYYHPSVEEARDRYCAGQSVFTQRIQKLSNQVGSDRFTWDVLPVCSKLDDFKLGNQTYRSQFREAERDHYLAQFSRKLTAICEASS
ncbi:MAG: AAA family ATPase [Hydrococcus sp. Prado102]|jgi:GTPase SAR1 family protein|nr:AAA family ATPase [Hydrococcus sp. Prado102]